MVTRAKIRPHRLYTVAEASHVLGVSETCLERAKEAGELMGWMTSWGELRFVGVDLESFARSR